MKLVIDIPDYIVESVKDSNICNYEKFKIFEAIKNGKPLPKGQGRLLILSEDAVKREYTSLGFSCQSWISDVGLSNATVAIIEANKE